MRFRFWSAFNRGMSEKNPSLCTCVHTPTLPYPRQGLCPTTDVLANALERPRLTGGQSPGPRAPVAPHGTREFHPESHGGLFLLSMVRPRAHLKFRPVPYFRPGFSLARGDGRCECRCVISPGTVSHGHLKCVRHGERPHDAS